MKYRKLGKTNFMVSEIGFGAWGIGDGWGNKDDKEAVRALERAYELGVNFYDTALVYGNGHSEELIGKTFAKKRDKVIIATKIPPKTYRWPVLEREPVSETFPSEHIISCTERSLKNLNTDYIDIQQLHAWTPSYLKSDELFETVEKLKKQGKIRAFGVSANDWDPYGTVGLVESGKIDTIQVIYNIFEQRPDEKLFPATIKNNVGIIVRVPFEEGLLTGTFGPDYKFSQNDWRRKWLTRERLIEAAPRIEALKKFLNNNIKTLAELALRFILSNPAVHTTIPGMRRTEHVEKNCSVSDGNLLTKEVLDELKKHAFVHGWAYPWANK